MLVIFICYFSIFVNVIHLLCCIECDITFVILELNPVGRFYHYFE